MIREECFDPDHDVAAHRHGELAGAAACYALLHARYAGGSFLWRLAVAFWPWEPEWWKPTPENAVHDLVRAGQLIAAEIDRIQHAAGSGEGRDASGVRGPDGGSPSPRPAPPGEGAEPAAASKRTVVKVYGGDAQDARDGKDK